ncbi:LYR motif-containing protein At3g19508 isoform X1 [Rhodamnia argentea]|uniref:LYR motif-containing protein At3g19508 isoform X1 n=1 Tax=Rhodamnia argentea TaxID=178133 RepID=A0A8B8NJU1_9MYRT|nr:LYR motif-containing protein At3g19508 isoform X1 [Rhodamnia argentea]
MEKALRVYGEVLRLVRRLPKDTRPYYAKYARENFVNYREVDAGDPKALDELFHRAYNHSIWVLNKLEGTRQLQMKSRRARKCDI